MLKGGLGSDDPAEQAQLKDSQSGAFNRPMDTNNSGFIEDAERLAAYNKAALKVQVLATPGQDPGETSAPGLDLWFGNIRAGQINGFKFEDINGNSGSGTYLDAGIDIPMKNVTMVFNGHQQQGQAVGPITTKTDVDGLFSFGGLLPGKYQVFEG